jgi:hypothetical protein
MYKQKMEATLIDNLKKVIDKTEKIQKLIESLNLSLSLDKLVIMVVVRKMY